MKKIIRISTVPISLNVFCRGLLCDLSHDYEIVAVSSPGEDLDELAARENVRAIAVPMRRHIAPFHDLWALWQLFLALSTRTARYGAQHHSQSWSVGNDSCNVG